MKKETITIFRFRTGERVVRSNWFKSYLIIRPGDIYHIPGEGEVIWRFRYMKMGFMEYKRRYLEK